MSEASQITQPVKCYHSEHPTAFRNLSFWFSLYSTCCYYRVWRSESSSPHRFPGMAVPKISKAVTQHSGQRAECCFGNLWSVLKALLLSVFVWDIPNHQCQDHTWVCREKPAHGDALAWWKSSLLEEPSTLQRCSELCVPPGMLKLREHLAFTPSQGIFCWCGSSWAHFTAQLCHLPSQPLCAGRGCPGLSAVIYPMILRPHQPQEGFLAPSSILAEQGQCPCGWCWGISLQPCCISDSSGNS